MTYTYERKKPDCAATMAILRSLVDHDIALSLDNISILIGFRDRNKPADSFPGYWCLPGGFLIVGKERVVTAARRETSEECSIDIEEARWKLFYVDDRPGADPRHEQVINVCYYAYVTNDEFNDAYGDDDIEEVKWITLREALEVDLAFDHNVVLRELITALNVNT